MKVKVGIYNEDDLWNDNPSVEIEMPIAPAIGMQLFLSEKSEMRLQRLFDLFCKAKGLEHTWVADCIYISNIAFDEAENIVQICLNDRY